MNKEVKEFILYAWNNETKEFWFLGEKIDYVHNPKEWKKYLNDLVTENKELHQKVNQLETNRDEAIDYIEEHSGMINRFTTIKSEYAQEELNVDQLDNLLEILKRGKE